MRKVLAMLALACALSASASADALEIRPYAGYTTVNMGDANADMQNLKGGLQLFVIFASGTYQEYENRSLSDGVVLGADISSDRILHSKSLKLAWRNEYLQTNEATYRAHSVSLGTLDVDMTEQGTLSSSLLGLYWSPMQDESSLKLSLGLFGGLGYGSFFRRIDFQNGGPYTSGLYSRLGFVGQFETKLDWQLSSHFSLGASCGYRLAALGQVFDGNGKSMQNSYGAALGGPSYAVGVDFSGYNATGALSFSF